MKLITIIMFLQILFMAVSCYAASFLKEPAPTTNAVINGSAKIDCVITGYKWKVPFWIINGTQYYPKSKRNPLPAGASTLSNHSVLLIDPVSMAWNNTSFQCRILGKNIKSSIGYLFVYYPDDLGMLDSSTVKHVISSSLAVPLTKKSCYKSTMPIEVEASLNDLSLHYVPTSVDYELSISSSSMYSMSEGSLNSEIEQTQGTNGVDHVDMRFVYVITPVLVTGTCLFIVVTLGISLRCYYIKKGIIFGLKMTY
ncbi:PREDICTED: uncharacterized protein LOC109587541 isoform X2 [Amphimedon queenslandica]|uniref:Ig-like domain-containing protein n=1 Tax=Amphimedon queenslandica TaxID=400682 RepID=A0AAN0JR72_AMPQE|nr:PREDICTED: uncharacterized protein LOC109587541 isoform X2 [Amphimedon queenslandica]|eukprot:XP_019859341.1 PREDICTED: uncharacterized protein LOC109587541 isoform X2 [Amphimedon queenslandica]